MLFKIRRWFDVTVLKWEELRNGAVQAAVQSWTMTATPQGDPWAVKKTGKTVDGGVVLPLTPGKWLIAETIISGWTPVTPASVYITLDQYAPPGATDPVIFKNLEPVCYATITVEKNGLGTDANGGQVWLGPLAGWKITLSRPDGAMLPGHHDHRWHGQGCLPEPQAWRLQPHRDRAAGLGGCQPQPAAGDHPRL